MGEREPMSAERLAELRETMGRCPSCPTCETALELIAEIDRLHAEVVALRRKSLSVAADLVRVTGRDGWPPDAVDREPVVELALRLRRAATDQAAPEQERAPVSRARSRT